MVGKSKDRGNPAVVVALDDAARTMRRQKRRRDDPPPAVPRGKNHDIYPNRKNAPPNWTENALGLPADPPCPVIPLGIENGLCHMLDSSGQIRSFAPKDFSHSGIQSLFGSTPNYPAWAWPRYGRAPKPSELEPDKPPPPPPIESFEDDGVRKALYRACDFAGTFHLAERLRGRGAWSLRGGQIIYHAGEELWIWDPGAPRPKPLPTGLVEGYLYPRLPELPAPWTERLDDIADEQIQGLFAMLSSLSWTRPMVDPLLLLGWIGVAYLGGALDWRSAVLLLGDKGWGKSTLQGDLKLLFGPALFDSGDTTKAGIYQDLEHDTRPVAVDELEPDASSHKVADLVNLMQVAASGAVTRRGSAGHRAVSFQVRSAFLFSAINNPLTHAQAFSRVAILRLRPLPPDPPPRPRINPDICGRVVLARLMREWPRFAETREAYMAALAAGGHDGRGQKTYGTLLAAADLILGAELAGTLGIPLTEDADFWRDTLAVEALPEIEGMKPNWRGCLEWLLTKQVDVWRGGARLTVGKVIADCGFGEDHITPREAAALLEKAGLGLMTARDLIDELAARIGFEDAGAMAAGLRLQRDDGLILAIPNDHSSVADLFAGSPWASGGGGQGPWTDALRQCPVPGVMLAAKRINRVRIGGVQLRCTLVVMRRYQEAAE